MNKIIKRLYRVAVSTLLVIGSIAYTPANVLATTGEPGTVTIDKTRDEGHEGVFEITLSIDGVPKVTPTDIVLVMDTSGSMQGSRMTSAKNAANNFVDEVLSWNQGHKIGIVSFASDPVLRQGLTDSKSSLNTAINALSAVGGTHIEGGIRLAKEMLDTGSSPNRNKAIVLMSDGEPTYGYDFVLGTYTGPGTVTWPPCRLTVSEADSNDFENNYTGSRYDFDYNAARVGLGNSMTFNRTVSSNQTCVISTATFTKTINLKDSVVWHANQAISAGYDIFSIGLEVNAAGADVLQASQNKGYYTATESNLQTIYGMIADNISLAATNAVVTDEIGAHFDFVSISDDYAGENTSYDSNTRILTWNVGNVGEQQRVLKYKVRLHDDAPGGTWPTNEWAKLDYVDINNTPQTKKFPKPEVSVGYIVELEANPEIGGSVSGEGRYLPNETVNIVATANAGFTFSGWSEDGGSGSSSNTTYSFTMPATDVKWIANFTENANITINYEAETGGSVSPDSETIGPVTGVAGGSVATANPGYSFVRWTKDDIQVSVDEEFIPEKVDGLNVAATYVAHFEENENVLIQYVALTGGTVSEDEESLPPATGEAQGSIASASNGYEFVNWTDEQDNVVSTEVNYVPSKNSENLNFAATYYANFREKDAVTIEYIANIGGTVSEDSETLAPVTGEAQGSTAIPSNGYEFVNWTNSSNDEVGDELDFIPAMVGGLNVAATYFANFKPIDYTLTINYIDVEGNTLATSYVNSTMHVNDPYSVVSPSVAGYLPRTATVTGQMDAENKTIDVIYDAIDYTFTFVPNGGDQDADVQGFNVGGSVNEPTFTREGYDFVGWTWDVDGIDEYVDGFIELAPKNVTVYAQWTAIDYTLTVNYIVNGGNATAPATVTDTLNFEDSYNVVSPVLPGYTVDIDAVTGTMPADDVTVTVTYTAIDYTLTVNYIVNGGNATAPATVTDTLNFEDSYNVVSPVLPGYTVDIDAVTGTMPADDVTVTVTYTAIDYTLTVNYIVNGGNATAPATVTDTLNFEDSYNVVSPVLPGYTVDIDAVTGTMPADDVTVTVTYTAIDYTLTINYIDVEGNTLATSYVDDEMTVGSTYSIGSPFVLGFIPRDFVVSGTMDASDRTIDVIYDAEDYTLTYVTNMDGLSYPDETFNMGDSIDAPVPSVPGYNFLGWFWYPNFDFMPQVNTLMLIEPQLELFPMFDDMPPMDVTVYAQWEVIDYTFTFDPNYGEEDVVEQIFNVGGSVEGTSFTRIGYEFVGWTVDEAGETEYTGGLDNLPAEDIYVYAQWEAIDYTFTFDPNYGEEEVVEQTFNVGGSVEGTSFTRIGYEFVGWTTDALGANEYIGGLTNLPAQDIYVYAQWEAIDYTFTFDPNYGEEDVVEQIFNVGGSVEGVSFTRAGFVFDGWTVDAEGLSTYTGGLSNLPAQDIYVYAQWQELAPEEFVLTFITNQPGLTIPSIVFIEGEAVVEPQPELEGFVFLGWYIDEDLLIEFDQFDSMPGQDVTVYADWGQVLGDEDEFEEEEETQIPDMSDQSRNDLGLLLFILGLLVVLMTRKEEELE